MSDHFFESTVLYDPVANKLSLNNSDPAEALAVCYSKQCHQFIKGKLHKCGPVGILRDFVQQFDVGATVEDIALINSYAPAEASWDQESLDKFATGLRNSEVIPQCKFCPSKMDEAKPFVAGPKKVKIFPIKSSI